MPGANPTITSYSASVVNFYNATDSLARFENKIIFFYFEKRSSLLQRCKFKSRRIGSRVGQLFSDWMPTYNFISTIFKSTFLAFGEATQHRIKHSYHKRKTKWTKKHFLTFCFPSLSQKLGGGNHKKFNFSATSKISENKQGCHISLCTTYQNGEKYQMTIKSTKYAKCP
jgi:hypothetical protein